MKKWFTEMSLNTVSMTWQVWRICMFWTAKTSQDKIWLKDTFCCNCCSSTQFVLTSVRFHTLITSWALLKIPNHIHNCWAHAPSPNLTLKSTTVPSVLINTLSSSWLEWGKTWPKFQSQRKAKNHQNIPRPSSFIVPASNHTKSRFWNCWKVLFTMEKSDRTGETVWQLKTKTKRLALWSSVVSSRKNTKSLAMKHWRKICLLTRKRFWKASFQWFEETSPWRSR